MINNRDVLETVRWQLATTESFSSLTASCDGVFPAIIVDALTCLSSKMTAASQRLSEAIELNSHRPFSDPRLPLPHPLDFEWRFSNASIDQLLRKLNAVAGPEGKLLFVCTPAVALRAFDANNPRQLIYASRLDDPVTSSLKEVCGGRMEFMEVRDDLSRTGAAAAVVDPPWYDDIALPLVTQALRGLKEGGGLLVGIPDRLSGCSSAPILSLIAKDATPFGIECARIVPGKLRYETPFFELNTLRHLGLRSVHPQWRTGRVAFGRKTRIAIPNHCFPTDGDWCEVSDGGWRMRLRRRGNDQPIGSGAVRFDVRRTVSRVAQRYQDNECWTVGNRVSNMPVAVAPATQFGGGVASAVRQIAEVEQREIRQLIDREPLENAMENPKMMLSVV